MDNYDSFKNASNFLGEAPLVAIIPPKRRDLIIKNIPLDALIWPLRRPKDIENKTIADLRSVDHVIRRPIMATFFVPTFGVKAKVSVVFSEPAAIQGHKVKLAKLLSFRFYRIFTIDKSLLKTEKKARLFTFGDTWVHEWRSLKIQKTKMLSLIASKKNDLDGHKLRHRVADWLIANIPDADVVGFAYKPIELKAEALVPHFYSVIIENSRQPSYFTEKLIDCFLCKTLPIYWGDPEIEHVFDPQGMIICKSFEEIIAAIKKTSEHDYLQRSVYLEKNREIAITYTQPYVTLAERLIADEE